MFFFKGMGGISEIMSENDFYRVFEDKHRGSRELIKSRLEIYLPFILHCQELDEECRGIDLGCGRGEWLEILTDKGFEVLGVDLDEDMLVACVERNLLVKKKDALLALRELSSESLVLVSGFHIAEHLPFEILKQVVKESLRVLKPGGLLILETPNPENIEVATLSFYLDPTHQKPLPPDLLSFLSEYYGFGRTKILRLQESSELRNSDDASFLDIISGVSPDYSIIAQKKAPLEQMELFNQEFEHEYGLTLNNLVKKHDYSLSQHFSNLETRVSKVNQKLRKIEYRFSEMDEKSEERVRKLEAELEKKFHLKIQEIESKTCQMEEAFNAIHNSRSWRITAPLRALGAILRNAWQTTKDFIKPFMVKMILFINVRPTLKKRITSFLRYFPKIDARLRRFANARFVAGSPVDIDTETQIWLEESFFDRDSEKLYYKLNRKNFP